MVVLLDKTTAQSLLSVGTRLLCGCNAWFMLYNNAKLFPKEMYKEIDEMLMKQSE